MLIALASEQRLFRREPLSDGGTARALTIVVGVSGGADSVCLLHALHRLASRWSLVLHVAHLDHSLRPHSAAEARQVAELAQALEVPFHAHKLQPGVLHDRPGGLENAARQARYHFLAETALQVTPPQQTPLIAVAHHADDQAETVLMNLARGSGLHGLGGMRPVSRLDPVFLPASDQADAPVIRLVRPLLTVGKSDILAYLQQHQLTWVEDESNQNAIHTRNLLRNQVLPLLRQINPNLTQTLCRTAEIAAAEAERVDALDRTHFKTLLLAQQPGRIVLDAERLLTFAQAAQRNILRIGLEQVAAAQVSMQQVEALLAALQKSLHASGPHPLLQNLSWTVAGRCGGGPARLSLHCADSPPFQPDSPHLDANWRATSVTQTITPGQLLQLGDWRLAASVLTHSELPPAWRRTPPWMAYLDAKQSGQPQLTTPQPGMRFAPLGLGGHHKSLGDFFTDQKIHSSLRAGWPIVIDGESGAILWVCGLRLAYPPRITNRTQQVLQLAWIKANPEK